MTKWPSVIAASASSQPRVQAALGEPADQRRGEEEADQIAAGRPGKIGRPGGGAGEDRQAYQAFAEIERDRAAARRAPNRAPSVSTASVCSVIGTG